MRRLAALLVAFLASCSNPICGCIGDDFLPSTAVINGAVLDSAAGPVSGVEVSVNGTELWTNPFPAMTGPDGRFSMFVGSHDGPDERLVDVLFLTPGSAAPDTLRDVPVTLRRGMPLDTVTVDFTVSE